jgi:Peptidase family M49
MRPLPAAFAACTLSLATCFAIEAQMTPAPPLVIAPDLEQRLARFVPVELAADLSALSAEDRKVLGLLEQVARHLDAIFLRQAWRGNPELAARVARLEGPGARAAQDYFQLNFGPWDRLSNQEPFLGDKPHPVGAGYYPEDLTKEAFEAWIKAHPADAEALTSLYTVVERQGSRLVPVPYSQAYREHLEPAAKLLEEAARTTRNASLRRFLEERAKAFRTDDYFASELAWMDLDSPVEITVGPYETYEDGLFGYKAAFEAYVTVALPQESAKLARYKGELPWLERNLPIDDRFKNFARGSDSPIRVVDLAAAGGEAISGVMAIAFNLPNDERVREAKGTKNVLMANVMRAKFERMLKPIAERVLAPADAAALSFEAFLEEVLHHELSHGLGPGTITVDGRKTEVRKELAELYSPLEEAKADVMGIYNLLALMEKGVVEPRLRAHLEPTYLAGLFRAARFGVHEAHGQGVVAQFNYLTAKGAVVLEADGRYRAVPEKLPGAIRELLAEMLNLQGRGDYAGTKAFLERWGQPTPAMLAALDRLKDLPTDIRPRFQSLQTGGAR